MKAKFLLVAVILAGLSVSQAWAQFPPRIEDHFWRRKIVNRIDLEEKINRPLVKKESVYYRGADTTSLYPNKDGLVSALFDGLKEMKYPAYDPDDLQDTLYWDEVLSRINQMEASATAETSFTEEAEADMGLDDGGDGFDSFAGESEEAMFDPFAPPEEEGRAEAEEAEALDDLGTDPAAAMMGADASNDMPNLVPFESVIQFVEDRIFDKNRSDLVYDIQYIEIIWVDPYGSLEDKRVCTFRYDQVLETLDQVQWKNRFNDAEYRSMREVFEMRMFHSFEIEISGRGANSLAEAEYRRQQLVEFEHHLWSY